MKAAVLPATKQIEVLDWNYRLPTPKEDIVKVKSCGICGTDQHISHHFTIDELPEAMADFPNLKVSKAIINH